MHASFQTSTSHPESHPEYINFYSTLFLGLPQLAPRFVIAVKSPFLRPSDFFVIFARQPQV
jgi:hypothetical protein